MYNLNSIQIDNKFQKYKSDIKIKLNQYKIILHNKI